MEKLCACPLLQKDNVRGYVGACGSFERVVRQADRAEQIGFFRKHFSGSRIMLIHRTRRGDKGDDTARSNLIERLNKEVIVNHQAVFVVRRVKDRKIAERNIADNDIKIVVGNLRILKALHLDIGVGIKHLSDLARHLVYLNSVKRDVTTQLIRQQTEKMTRTTGRVKNGSVGKAHIIQRFVNGLYNNRRCVKGCESRITGSAVFLLRKQFAQLLIMVAAGSKVL